MKNKFIKSLRREFIKYFIVILIVCGWWIYDVESNNKYIPGYEKLKHQTLSALSLNEAHTVKEIGVVNFGHMKRMEEEQQARQRSGSFYKKLKATEEAEDYLSLNRVLHEGFMEDKGDGEYEINMHNFFQAFRFSEDKVINLHEQEKVDPRYYLQHANLSWNYVALLKRGLISSPNMAESYNKIMDATVRYFQYYLLVQEDIARCGNTEYAKKEFNSEHSSGEVQKYKDALEKHGNLLRSSAKNATINISDSAVHRMPNAYVCVEEGVELELISDEKWQIKRAEVRKRFLEEYFPEN